MVAECESIKAFPAALDSTKHRIEKVCKNSVQWAFINQNLASNILSTF